MHKSNTFIKAAVKWNAFSDAPSLSEYRNSQKVQSCKQKIDSCSKKGEEKQGIFPYICFYLLIEEQSVDILHTILFVAKATKNKIFAFYKYVRSLREFDPILHNNRVKLSPRMFRSIVIPCPPTQALLFGSLPLITRLLLRHQMKMQHLLFGMDITVLKKYQNISFENISI